MDIDEKLLERFILGETNETFRCVNEEENQKVAVVMLQQAELHLEVLSHDLDPLVYDNEACRDAIEELALRSRHSRIRILLHDPQKVSKRGHLLLHLGKRLGGLIKFRRMAEIYRPFPETFMIVDGIGYMHRTSSSTIAATVNFKDRPKAKELLQLFEKFWINAEPDPNTQYIVI